MLHTYNPDFHHSMTMAPVNVEEAKKAEEVASKEKWRTPAGFVFPGRKSMIQSNVHPMKPGSPRREELKEVRKCANVSGYWLYAYID